jgi:acyl-coenzyme A thioesterase PaaI-like protein
VIDISPAVMSVPGRLGLIARFEESELRLDLLPMPETLHLGVVRASVLSFVIDAVAGIVLDQDPEVWTFTSDMSVRMRPTPAPGRIEAVNTIVRRGGRSATCQVELTADDGRPVATGAIGFVNVPRKESDPPKYLLRPEQALGLFDICRDHPSGLGLRVTYSPDGQAKVWRWLSGPSNSLSIPTRSSPCAWPSQNESSSSGRSSRVEKSSK